MVWARVWGQPLDDHRRGLSPSLMPHRSIGIGHRCTPLLSSGFTIPFLASQHSECAKPPECSHATQQILASRKMLWTLVARPHPVLHTFGGPGVLQGEPNNIRRAPPTSCPSSLHEGPACQLRRTLATSFRSGPARGSIAAPDVRRAHTASARTHALRTANRA